MSAGGPEAPGVATKHVIVVLWFEVAVLCSKLLFVHHVGSGGEGAGRGRTGSQREGAIWKRGRCLLGK